MYRNQPATSTENSLQTQQFTQRANVAPHVMTAFHFKGFHLVPSFTLHETVYSEKIVQGRVIASPLLESAPEFGLDLIMPSFERVFHKKTFLGVSLKHVFEPRASYRYVGGISDYSQIIRFDKANAEP